jgi:hypothetical protein
MLAWIKRRLFRLRPTPAERLAEIMAHAIVNSPLRQTKPPEWPPEGKTMWRLPRGDA